jgi:hypothetical protein
MPTWTLSSKASAAQPDGSIEVAPITPSLDIPAHGTPAAALFACPTTLSGATPAGGNVSTKPAEPLNPSSA